MITMETGVNNKYSLPAQIDLIECWSIPYLQVVHTLAFFEAVEFNFKVRKLDSNEFTTWYSDDPITLH